MIYEDIGGLVWLLMLILPQEYSLQRLMWLRRHEVLFAMLHGHTLPMRLRIPPFKGKVPRIL